MFASALKYIERPVPQRGSVVLAYFPFRSDSLPHTDWSGAFPRKIAHFCLVLDSCPKAKNVLLAEGTSKIDRAEIGNAVIPCHGEGSVSRLGLNRSTLFMCWDTVLVPWTLDWFYCARRNENLPIVGQLNYEELESINLALTRLEEAKRSGVDFGRFQPQHRDLTSPWAFKQMRTLRERIYAARTQPAGILPRGAPQGTGRGAEDWRSGRGMSDLSRDESQ